VTHGRREHEFVVFEVLIVLGEAAERLGDIVRNRGLLGDDEGFGHIVSRRTLLWFGTRIIHAWLVASAFCQSDNIIATNG
jgi:hypothetical protein